MSKCITYPRSFKSKKYPKFINGSLILRIFPKPEKVFPQIGLPNSETALERVKMNQDALYMLNIDKLNAVLHHYRYNYNGGIEQDLYYLRNTVNNYLCGLPGNKLMVSGYRINCINFTGRKDVFDVVKLLQAHIAKNERGAFRYLERFVPASKFTPSQLFGSKRNKLKICFSSSSNKGYWDIATMSMRGISSCMRWGSSHAPTLAGTIVDPYAGVIYITDGTTNKYGKTMLARAVVRLVVGNKGKKPALLLETVYPDAKTFASVIFTSFLKQRTGMSVSQDDYKCSIPISAPTAAILASENGHLRQYESNTLSYRDSGVKYSRISKFYDPKKVRNQQLDNH